MICKCSTVVVALLSLSGAPMLFLTQGDQAKPMSTANRWEQFPFGRTLENGEIYGVTKLVVTIPKNSNQKMQFGLDVQSLKLPNLGPLVNPEAELTRVTIDDRNKLDRFEGSFQEFLRLETIGAAVYGDLGVVKVFTNDRGFSVRISERGFIIGDGPPNRNNTFYSWTLAKIIDEELRLRFNQGFKKQYFDLLSGQRIIDSDKMVYENRSKTSAQE